jgi:hypothetical protein
MHVSIAAWASQQELQPKAGNRSRGLNVLLGYTDAPAFLDSSCACFFLGQQISMIEDSDNRLWAARLQALN